MESSHQLSSLNFIDDICDQLSSHIPGALHADDLALWTKAEQVTAAATRMQETMNLISDWAKEWLVMINRTKTEATCFSLSPKREEFILQSCPTFDTLRHQTWPSLVDTHRKRWEPAETLRQTPDFTLLTGLKI